MLQEFRRNPTTTETGVQNKIILYLKHNDSVRHIFSELVILIVYGLYII